MYSSGIVIMASSIGLPWVTDYWLFCVLQFMTGTSILALFMTGYVICKTLFFVPSIVRFSFTLYFI